jgi:hypothetical protein
MRRRSEIDNWYTSEIMAHPYYPVLREVLADSWVQDGMGLDIRMAERFLAAFLVVDEEAEAGILRDMVEEI